jgi:hypothetical protein
MTSSCMLSILYLSLLSFITTHALTVHKHAGRRACVCPRLRASLDDDTDRPKLNMPEENDGPKISVREKVEGTQVKDGVRKSGYESSTQSTAFNTDRLFMDDEDKKRSDAQKATGSATFGGMTIDSLQARMQDSPYRAQSWDELPDQKEDLNGINPVTTIAFSVLPMGMSYGLIQLTTWLSEHFAIDQIDSPIYPIQRGAVVARNLVVGITSLATGFTGVVGLGLLAMGIAVAVGVAKGELDPNADNATGRVE